MILDIDVSELLQCKKVSSVFGVVEGIGGSLINRNGPGIGGRIGCMSCMDLQGFESFYMYCS